MNRYLSLAVCTAAECIFLIQAGAAQDKPKPAPANPPAESPAVCDVVPSQVGGNGPRRVETRFDPACYVRIYADNGKGKRQLLYDWKNPDVRSRLLRIDPESTVVFDMANALASGQRGDMSLNKMLVKADIKKKDAARALEVTGYSQIGESAASKPSQIAFAFQTFANVAGKLINLFFTSKELIDGTFGTSACFLELAKGERTTIENVNTACALGNQAESDAKIDRFGNGLRLFMPEVEALADFFSSPDNRTIEAQLAADVFEIDIESLQGIATQFKTQRAKLDDPNISGNVGLRRQVILLLLERSKLAVKDMSGLMSGIQEIRTAATTTQVTSGGLDLNNVCPQATTDRRRTLNLQAVSEFARVCMAEFKRVDYLEELRIYLVEGTIDLAKNSADSGDTVTLTFEARAPGQEETGARAEFRIRVANYGWKAGVEPSMFLVKRIGVNEADANRPDGNPVKGLQPIRFAPFPGMNLTASYHGKHNGGLSFLHVLAPGFGVNATFMTFGTKRDFDPTANNNAGQFVTVKGNNFEIGTGPVMTLFGNRVSVTYGWNLMASDRRTYWGLGFGFLSLGKDLAGLIKKN